MNDSDAARPAVLAIIRDVLDKPAVQFDDDLLDHGFDSLAIVRTAAWVRERLDVDLPLATYFDVRTPAELATAVAAATAAV
jgi:acyl carrier protein